MENRMEKDKKDIGYRINLYLPTDMVSIYKKLNKNLKENGTCISQEVQKLIIKECKERGINE